MSLVPFDLDTHRRSLEKAQKSEGDHVLSGKCASFDDYKQRVGKIRGLQMALDEINTTLQKMENDE